MNVSYEFTIKRKSKMSVVEEVVYLQRNIEFRCLKGFGCAIEDFKLNDGGRSN